MFSIFAAFLDEAMVRILYLTQNFLMFLKHCRAPTEKWLSVAAKELSSEPDQSNRLNWQTNKNRSKSVMFFFSFNEILKLI